MTDNPDWEEGYDRDGEREAEASWGENFDEQYADQLEIDRREPQDPDMRHDMTAEDEIERGKVRAKLDPESLTIAIQGHPEDVEGFDAVFVGARYVQPESMTDRIHDLVLFAARMDREMEDTLLMEGDDEWLASLDGPQLGDALAEAERMIRAARTIKRVVEEHLEMDIREHGAIRLGDSGYYVGKATKRTLHDAEGLLKWLDTPDRIGKAIRVNASNVRIGVVRGYASEAALGEDAVMDTFFEETVDEEALKKVPESKAKWVQELGTGERRE